MTHEEIIEAARLEWEVDNWHAEQIAQRPAEFAELLASLDRAASNRTERILISLARKMLAGRPYSITSDNPRTIERARALAKFMGAHAEEGVANDLIAAAARPSTQSWVFYPTEKARSFNDRSNGLIEGR